MLNSKKKNKKKSCKSSWFWRIMWCWRLG